MALTANLKISDEPAGGIVVLSFGPQPINFLSKASKFCGKGAIVEPNIAHMAGANIAAGAPEALEKLREILKAGALQREQTANPGAPAGAVEWLANGERGLSSEALFTRLSGINATGERTNHRKAHPLDPADLRRCRLMLEAVPSLVQHLHMARALSPEWDRLVEGWAELCALMDEETPDWREAKGQKAERTYKHMKQLLGR